MRRRTFLFALASLPLAIRDALSSEYLIPKTLGEVEELRLAWRRLAPDGMDLPDVSEILSLSEFQWEARLDGDQYRILRREGTERPFSSVLNDEKRGGLYLCAGCDLPLFSSEMKYDSGTGWPSFFTTIPGHLATRKDFKLLWPRDEYHCLRCGGHHGHVFGDGPPPTGQRWCNNGVALQFVAA